MEEAEYLDITGAFEILKEMGLVNKRKQVQDAADRGNLPFFKDPVSGRRMIARSRLLAVYRMADAKAAERFKERSKC